MKNKNTPEVGDRIRILRKPSQWSSLLNNKCPFSANLTYPYTIIVQDTRPYNISSMEIALTCGNYGWDWKAIVEAGFEYLKDSEEENQLIEIL